MDKEREMITTNEAAEILKVKPSTIHKYVKQGELKPVYEDNWHIDNTKLFYNEDVEELKKKKGKPGITTGEASKLLGLHTATIFQYIQQGLLAAEKKLYKGREFYFITPEELERFKSFYEEQKRNEGKDFYDKDTNYAWYQEFLSPEGKDSNFLLLNEELQPYLHSQNGEQIPYEEIEKAGYKPVKKIPDIGYKTQKGFAKFQFTESPEFYRTMGIFYSILGPKNIKVFIDKENKITVEVKPILIKEDIPGYIFSLLEESIIEGDITKRLEGLFIDSDLEVLAIAIPSKLKRKIKEEAAISKYTIEELVISILNEKYDN
ncbi:helix-turn-helix domain-containing protein (plasmid) [Cytobacillus pseudoceanisediminis]|uniref:helix-turn-helix domain-containing protein n=1 Tax=Cytobacillus pseudoceanisediminis TaxID=3051614 RepID=UPI00218AC8A0|nr:helix-turn-helix domain-containing protein [Cytobacillus pseudoceanisediminis]UQX57116.1 helix-turn-helix domain-containing protein [Cytobacillus pseudoceanisediminis]